MGNIEPKVFLKLIDREKLDDLDRVVYDGTVRSFLSKPEKLERIEHGKEKEQRFKLWFKMSRRYSLVIIVEIHLPKSLKVVSCWNTDRKWQGKLQR